MADDVIELSTKNESFKNKIGSYDEKGLVESKGNLLKQFDNEERGNLILSQMQKQMEKTIEVRTYRSYDKLWRLSFIKTSLLEIGFKIQSNSTITQSKRYL